MTTAPAARTDIIDLRSYIAGEQIENTIRLNANEAPVSRDLPALNRYPEVHPETLRRRMSEIFGVAKKNLLVTRGSSESIDVLTRAWCRAYTDSLITTPPTFEMYRVYADIQGVAMIDVPLDDADDFSLDVETVIASCTPATRLIFVCSPNNPTGTLVPEEDILAIARSRSGKSLVVVDEAYIEFADRDSMAKRVTEYGNLVVLRTLSKAHALAGARCGATIASETVIDVIGKVLPPYSFPSPVIDSVTAALTRDRIGESAASVAAIVGERVRVFDELQNLPCVTKAWRSQSNFILTRFSDLIAVNDHLLTRKILIRDFSAQHGLENCARITIGTPAENDALLRALTDFGASSND